MQQDRKIDGLKSLNKLAIWIYCIFGILLIINIVAAWSDAQLIERGVTLETVSQLELMEIGFRNMMIFIADFTIGIASAVVFLMWIYRAYKNLAALGATGLRFTPGWAVGWFFIPIANLVRPYQVTSEIWKASEPKVDTTDSTSWKNLATSPIVGWWWALFLISSFIAAVASEFPFYGTMVSEIVDIIGISITILMVRRISQLQELKGELISRNASGI